MDWSYIAGLFDGDGHPSIALKNQLPRSIQITARITGGNKEQFRPIKDFLKQSEIHAGIHRSSIGKHKSKAGWRQHTSYVIQISGRDDAIKFFEMILPHILFKRKQCEIALKGLKFWKYLSECGKSVEDNLHYFDKLRHELHKYARKGPKTLKSWF